jgi:hypothetical protein
MPGYPCGCVSYPPPPCVCINCTSLANPLSVMISGMSGLRCNICYTGFSGTTFALVQLDPQCCCWSTGARGFYCSGVGYGAFTITMCVTNVGMSGNLGWELTFTMTLAGMTDTVTYIWDSGGSAPFDCTATRVVTPDTVSISPGGPICSDVDSLTITINP